MVALLLLAGVHDLRDRRGMDREAAKIEPMKRFDDG
jgi:hypothetical protein